MPLTLKDLRLICWAAFAAVSCFVAGGCDQRDEITRYTVLKPEVVDPTLVAGTRPAATLVESRTLGLIVPVGETGWFFKLTGEAAAVEAQNEAFLQFVTSLKFSAGAAGKPEWTLPEGWKEQPGAGMRYATIQVPGDAKPLDLSVIPLPRSGDTQKYVLDNINRWRGQLNLKPITADELSTTTKTLKIGEHEATLVSLLGSGSGGMGAAPLAPFASGQLPPDHPPIGGSKSPSP
jgi:hypothetical protein